MPSSHSRKGALIHAKACRAPFGDCCAGFVVCINADKRGKIFFPRPVQKNAPAPISYPDNVWQKILLPSIHLSGYVVSKPSELAYGYDK